jgi:hypothetical protein
MSLPEGQNKALPCCGQGDTAGPAEPGLPVLSAFPGAAAVLIDRHNLYGADPATGVVGVRAADRAGATARQRHRSKSGRAILWEIMARVTGLEPATFGVTGRRSNQLSYTRAKGLGPAWWRPFKGRGWASQAAVADFARSSETAIKDAFWRTRDPIRTSGSAQTQRPWLCRQTRRRCPISKAQTWMCAPPGRRCDDEGDRANLQCTRRRTARDHSRTKVCRRNASHNNSRCAAPAKSEWTATARLRPNGLRRAAFALGKCGGLPAEARSAEAGGR